MRRLKLGLIHLLGASNRLRANEPERPPLNSYHPSFISCARSDDQERMSRLGELSHERIGAVHEAILADDDALHVHEPADG
jgi:hypothetical protein